MGEKTQISWCRSTHNFWWGCTEVSPECDECYARGWAERMGWQVWGKGVPRRLLSAKHNAEPLKWNAQAEKTGEFWPVFCQSMSDWADREVPDEWRTIMWDVIRRTPALTWLMLTKRAGDIKHFLPPDWGDGWPHVWHGVTVGLNASMWRAHELLKIPAAIRWISAEPMLESVCFLEELDAGIDWLVVGGESSQQGKQARPFDTFWAAHNLVDCMATNKAFYFKQMGDNVPDLKHLKARGGKDPSEWPPMFKRQEFPAIVDPARILWRNN